MEVTLEEILEAREQRAAKQQQLLSSYRETLLCYTLNIPGPVKYTADIGRLFDMGRQATESQLKGEGIRLLHTEAEKASAGCTAYYVLDRDPLAVKKLAAELEDRLSYGRLLDLDVLCPDGRKVSREALGLPKRKCLICGQDAVVCGRSRAHSVAQLQDATRAIIDRALSDFRCEKIASSAVKSLLFEVCTTPKPGLVDLEHSGSHEDMDVLTFMASASTLFPYFQACAKGKCLADLRLPGKLAEGTMALATGGVNTHKGAIFSLGIACAVVGQGAADGEAFEKGCAAFCADILEDFQSRRHTHGEDAFDGSGVTGVRGQAHEGFPAVTRVGLPVLEQGLRQGLSLTEAGACTLLHLIASTDDTNLIRRGGRAAQLRIQKELAAQLQKTPYPSADAIRRLDKAFTAERLSPGGSADLLALTYFLYFIKEEV